MGDSRARDASFAFGLFDVEGLDVVAGKLAWLVSIVCKSLIQIGHIVWLDGFLDDLLITGCNRLLDVARVNVGSGAAVRVIPAVAPRPRLP